MDISSAKWLSELEMEDPNLIQQYQMDSFPDPLNYQSFSCESYSSYPNFNTKDTHNNTASFIQIPPQNTPQKPAKQLKTSSFNSCTSDPKSSAPSHFISFENCNSNSPPAQCCTIKAKNEASNVEFSSFVSPPLSCENQSYSPKYGEGNKRIGAVTRSPSHAQDHVIAERKRREKLSQRFVALSSIIPGLKKMDKASVLGDAIEYVKQLRERVKVLEEQTTKKTVESVVFVKKSQLFSEEETSSTDENFDGQPSDQSLPEIEARVCGKDILIRIQCEKQKGLALKVLSEIEKLHLIVINSSVLPFGDSLLDITVVAEMDVEFSMSMKDLVRSLRVALPSSSDMQN